MDLLDFNLTESHGNVTQPQWDIGPWKGPDGFSGSGEHFGVKYNVIKIKDTDAVFSNFPSEELREKSFDEDGKFSYYEQHKKESDVYQDWMNKIGPYLADWALGLPRHANPPWRLLKFPDNYTLWVHKKGVKTDRYNARIDVYLFGAPHLGPPTARSSQSQLSPSIFRSPMEFVPHAIWLLKGRTGQCDCKYCIPGQSQKDINRRLRRGVDADSDDDADDDDDDDNAVASRRRGANSRTRRVKRDRSPPINLNAARDYRVGVSDPGPSSAI